MSKCSHPEFIDLPVWLHDKTSKHYLLSLEGTSLDPVWIPRRICQLLNEARIGMSNVLTIQENLAIDKGLA